jgi:preprotein translocase subunit YajC
MEPLMQFGPLILLVAVMYFFFIRPQAKKQREQSKFLDNLEKGQDIVTTSGMLGRIVKIEDQIVTLEVDQKTFVRVTKTAISKEFSEGVFPANGTK